ncbi:MAG: hypothetical protein B2I17_07960 [Thermoplasmatales archaeon B_DKE]|nr:MAG: hypothetical protein B2I17_07960 [Thermoplasmatales archaeon B_DKE]
MSGKITISEILPPQRYGVQREQINHSVIELEKKRRVTTRTFSYLFEHKEIILNQIEEMVFLENVTDKGEIGDLIEIYSELMPSNGTLSVSMFIEISDQGQLLREMPMLSGIEKTVYLVFDEYELKATPEEGRSTDVLESTLQYLKFSFNREQLSKFEKAKNAFIETRKPGYQESARISQDLLETLKSELLSEN